MDGKRLAYLSAFAYSCTIGFSFLFVKVALRSATPFDVLAHRFMAAFLCAIVPPLLGRARFKAGPRELVSILPLAILNPISFFLLQTLGLVYISSSEAGIVQALAPVFALLLAIPLLGERSNRRQIASVLVSVGGVVFISVMGGANSAGGGEGAAKGLALVLAATLSFSLYTVFTRKLTRRFSVFELTFVMSLAGFVAFGLFAALRRALVPAASGFFAPFSEPSYLVAILFLGCASSFLSSFFSNFALSRIEASKMSVFGNLATVIAIFAGVVLLSEPFHWYHVLGTLLIVAGVLGANR